MMLEHMSHYWRIFLGLLFLIGIGYIAFDTIRFRLKMWRWRRENRDVNSTTRFE
jgi:hypothetical protein